MRHIKFDKKFKHKGKERGKMAEKAGNKKPKYMSVEWFQMKEETTKDISYRLEPDDMCEWEGLVAPNGDFYSCGFGMHAIKAWRLILTHPERFGLNPTDEEKDEWMMPRNVYEFLDIAIDHGWAATREIGGSCYYTLPVRTTKAQMDTIFCAMQKHGVRLDTEELMCC